MNELVNKTKELMDLNEKKTELLEKLYLYALIEQHHPDVKTKGGRFFVTTQKRYRRHSFLGNGIIMLKGVGLWDRKSDDLILCKIDDKKTFDKTEYDVFKITHEFSFLKDKDYKVISFNEQKITRRGNPKC